MEKVSWKDLDSDKKVIVESTFSLIKELASKFPPDHDARIYGFATYNVFVNKIKNIDNSDGYNYHPAEEEVKDLFLKFVGSLLPINKIAESIYEVGGEEIKTKARIEGIIDFLLSHDNIPDKEELTLYDVLDIFLKKIGVGGSTSSDDSKETVFSLNEGDGGDGKELEEVLEFADKIRKDILPIDDSDTTGGEALIELMPPFWLPGIVSEILLVVKDTKILSDKIKDPDARSFLRKWERAFNAVLQESITNGVEDSDARLLFYTLLLLKVLGYTYQRRGDGLLFLAVLLTNPIVPIILKNRSDSSVLVIGDSSTVHEIKIPMGLFEDILRTVDAMVFGAYPRNSKVYERWVKKGSLFTQ